MKREVFFGLIFILILALGLRWYGLSQESLWNDEAFSIKIAQEPSVAHVITEVMKTEAAPPGYYLLLHYWIQLMGNSVFMLRFLSVVFSVLAIVVLFLTVRMILNPSIALLSALFMATSMLQIEYAQEVRIYGLFTFLSLCSVYFFAKWHKSPERKRLWQYGFFTLLALYVNYMMVFLVAGYSLFLFSKREEFVFYKKKWIEVHAFVFLLCVPLLFIMGTQFQTLNTGLSQTLINKGMPSFLAQLGLFLFALPALAFVMALAIVISRPRVRNVLLKLDNYFFPLMLLIGFGYLYVSMKPVVLHGIPFIRVPITNSYFLIRHSFFLVPLWYVYLGYKVDDYYKKGRKYFAVSLVIIILLFSFFALHQYYVQPTKGQWQEAIQFIEEHSDSAKVLVLLDKGGQSNEFLFRYYAPDDWPLLRLTWAEQWRDFQQIDEERMFSLLDKTDEFWLVLSRNPKTGYYYRNLLDEKYGRVQSKELYGVNVYQYKAISQ